MTVVPQSLAGWNLEVVQRLVDLELPENDQFEFKHSLESPAFGPNLRKSVCSFANTRGGFLVFGVGEQGVGRGRILGLQRSREYGKQVQDQLLKIEPSVLIDMKDPPITVDEQRIILVVHVPQGRRGPHWDAGSRKFWRRGQGTCVEMSHEEVRMAFTDHAARVTRMRLLYLSLIDNWMRVDDIVKSAGSEGPVPVTVVDPGTIRALLADASTTQPDIVEALLAILLELDIINSRCAHMVHFAGRSRELLAPDLREHREEIRRTMRDLHPQVDWVLKCLRDAYGFDPVRPRGVWLMPPLPPPGL